MADNLGYSHSNMAHTGGWIQNEGLASPKKTAVPDLTFVEPATKSTSDLLSRDEKDQEKRDREPLRYCRWITERPKLFLGLTLVIQISFFAILGILVVSGVEVVSLVFDRVSLEIKDDVDYLRGLAWDERNKDTDVIDRIELTDGIKERANLFDTLGSYFYIENGNVLTRENLIKIKETEEELFSFEKYRNEYCKLDSSGECEIPSSPIRYFDGTFAHVDPIFNDPNFDNVIAVLHAANTLPETKRDFQQYLGKNAVISATEATSEITRMTITIGYPLAGYDSVDDDEEGQQSEFEKFCLDDWNPVTEKYYNNKVGDMSYYYSSQYMLNAVLVRQVIYDQALAGGSMVFIFLFVYLQTQSLWVTSLSLFSIFSSFVLSTLIYRYFFDIRFFGVFHVLAVFIVLGIGADNTFVFFDTWKETGFYKYKTLAHRLSDAYRKAVMAMFFTSFTTTAAFVISAISPLLSVSTFGSFSGILISVNYILVITVLPVTIVTYHYWWDQFKCCCCCPRDVDPIQEEAPKQRWIVKFFSGPYFSAISHKVARWVFLGLCMAFIGFCAYSSSRIEVQEEQMKMLKDSSNFGRYQTLTNTAFLTNEINVRVLVTWGLQEQDLDRCHSSDVYCMGDTVWDESFNMNSAEAQRDLIEFCDKIRTLPEEKVKDLALAKNVVTGIPEVQCFTDQMAEFYENEGATRLNDDGSRRFPAGVDFRFPFERSDAEEIIAALPDVYDASKLGDVDRYFELAVSYWMMNAFELHPNILHSEYNDWIGVTDDSPDTGYTTMNFPLPNRNSSSKYTYGTKLRYMSIIANLTLSPNSLGYPSASPIRDDWEDFVSQEVAAMSDGMKGGVMCTPLELTGDNNAWHWLKTQRQLVQSAILGIVIGICIAFPILVFATGNILIGCYATFTIICVVVSVLGFIPVLDWKLGVLESMNLVLVVGLSVDYVVHLAEGYRRSSHTDRLGRTRDMLQEVGVSVLSGAVTTLGAAAFLLFAQIVFFVQFGLFMFFTITFSIVYSLLLFTTFMALAGPQGETGSLKPLYDGITRLCCHRKSPTRVGSIRDNENGSSDNSNPNSNSNNNNNNNSNNKNNNNNYYQQQYEHKTTMHQNHQLPHNTLYTPTPVYSPTPLYTPTPVNPVDYSMPTPYVPQQSHQVPYKTGSNQYPNHFRSPVPSLAYSAEYLNAQMYQPYALTSPHGYSYGY